MKIPFDTFSPSGTQATEVLRCKTKYHFRLSRKRPHNPLKGLQRERVYTDCGDFDNFKRTLSEVNQVLEGQGVRLAVWEDFVYCDCEYTLLLLDRALAARVYAEWESENFMIYL